LKDDIWRLFYCKALDILRAAVKMIAAKVEIRDAN